MPIRIMNDGGPSYTTRIFDAETDQDITALLHVTRIDLVLDVPSMPVATLSCYAPKVDVTVNEAQVIQVCPYCGREKTSTLHSAKDIGEQPESDKGQ